MKEYAPSSVSLSTLGCHMKNAGSKQWGHKYPWSAPQRMPNFFSTAGVVGKAIGRCDQAGGKEHLHANLISCLSCRIEKGVRLADIIVVSNFYTFEGWTI